MNNKRALYQTIVNLFWSILTFYDLDTSKKIGTPAKSFGKRFRMWIICHCLTNDFYEVSEHKKLCNQKASCQMLELLKNHVQFMIYLGFVLF
jgi:hypothetical protein